MGRSLLESLQSASAPTASSADLRGQLDYILGRLKAVGYVEDYTVEWRKPGGESLADEPDLRIQLRVRIFIKNVLATSTSHHQSQILSFAGVQTKLSKKCRGEEKLLFRNGSFFVDPAPSDLERSFSQRPADLQGSQLLRAEEGSFWQVRGSMCDLTSLSTDSIHAHELSACGCNKRPFDRVAAHQAGSDPFLIPSYVRLE